jgi:anti-sigma factor RsiW
MKTPLTQDAMIELMAYADGELDDAERARIEARIATEPDAKRFLDELRGLGDFVREGHAARRDAAGVDKIADGVMAALARPEAKVVPITAARAHKPGLARPITVATLVALAAGVVLWMQSQGEQQRKTAERPLPLVTSEPVASLEPPGPPTPAKIDEADEVDSPHQVSVFYEPSTAAAKAPSVVVWIGDDDNGASPR